MIFILIMDSHESVKQTVLIHVLFFFVCTKTLWAIKSVPSEEFDQTAQMCGLIEVFAGTFRFIGNTVPIILP